MVHLRSFGTSDKLPLRVGGSLVCSSSASAASSSLASGRVKRLTVIKHELVWIGEGRLSRGAHAHLLSLFDDVECFVHSIDSRAVNCFDHVAVVQGEGQVGGAFGQHERQTKFSLLELKRGKVACQRMTAAHRSHDRADLQ